MEDEVDEEGTEWMEEERSRKNRRADEENRGTEE